MKVTKAKTAAIVAPQTIAEADEALARLGEAQRAIARLEAGMNDALDKVKATFAEQAEPHQLQAAELTAGLAAFAAANRKSLTGGNKTKQVKLNAGIIGWRCAPPSIAFKRGFKIDAIVAALKEMKLKRFIRVTETPNKEAMLEEPEIAATVSGVTVKTGIEAFYAEPTNEDIAEAR